MSKTPRLTCPHCGEGLDLLQALAEGDARELMELLAGFGQHAPAVRAYVELFKAGPGAGLQMARRLKLVRELAGLWEREEFAYEGRTWRISRGAIAQCLQEVLRAKAAPCGFRDHNYLKKVMSQHSGHTEAKREQAREDSRRTAGGQGRGGAPVRVGEVLPGIVGKASDGQPEGPSVLDQPLPAQVRHLAGVYNLRAKGMEAAFAWVDQIEGNLTAAGLSLDMVRELAGRDVWKMPDEELMACCGRES